MRLPALYFAIVSAAFVSPADAQTSGFILTRPDCVPLAQGEEDEVNYIQGPDPILLPAQGISILVDAGECCGVGGHWEGILSLNYPASGQALTPRFNPI
jgi:hypothetical protein